MLRALLLVAREIAVAHDRWLARLVRRRPRQIDLLRARLLRLHPRRRPRYRAWERLAILWHRTRYGLSVSATARAFVPSASGSLGASRANTRSP